MGATALETLGFRCGESIVRGYRGSHRPSSGLRVSYLPEPAKGSAVERFKDLDFIGKTDRLLGQQD